MPTKAELLAIPAAEKIERYNAMVGATFSHVNGRDLLAELHPRKQLDIKRRVDGVETWFATFPPERGHRMVTLSIGPDVPAGCAGWARPRD